MIMQTNKYFKLKKNKRLLFLTFETMYLYYQIESIQMPFTAQFYTALLQRAIDCQQKP